MPAMSLAYIIKNDQNSINPVFTDIAATTSGNGLLVTAVTDGLAPKSYLYLYDASTGSLQWSYQEPGQSTGIEINNIAITQYARPVSIDTSPTGDIYVAYNPASASALPFIALYKPGADNQSIGSTTYINLPESNAQLYNITDTAWSLADSSLYVTGSHGTFDFDGKPSSNDGDDSFLIKYNASGNKEWSTPIAGLGPVEVESVSTSSSGNILIAGQIYSPGMDLPVIPGLEGLLGDWTNWGFDNKKSTGSADYFVASYSPSGALQWSASGGFTQEIGIAEYIKNGGKGSILGSTEIVTDSAVGGDGSVVIVGTFFEPEVQNLHGFIAKYSSTGGLLWRKLTEFSLYGVEIDASDNIIASAEGPSYEEYQVSTGTGFNASSSGSITAYRAEAFPADYARIIRLTPSGESLPTISGYLGAYQVNKSGHADIAILPNGNFAAFNNYTDFRGTNLSGFSNYLPREASSLARFQLSTSGAGSNPIGSSTVSITTIYSDLATPDPITQFSVTSLLAIDAAALKLPYVEGYTLKLTSIKSSKSLAKAEASASDIIFNGADGKVYINTDGTKPGLGDGGGLVAVLPPRSTLKTTNLAILNPRPRTLLPISEASPISTPPDPITNFMPEFSAILLKADSLGLPQLKEEDLMVKTVKGVKKVLKAAASESLLIYDSLDGCLYLNTDEKIPGFGETGGILAVLGKGLSLGPSQFVLG